MANISVNLYPVIYPSDSSNISLKASFRNEVLSTCYEYPGYLLIEDNNPHGNLQINNKFTGEKPKYFGPKIKLQPSYVAIQPGEIKYFKVSLQDYGLIKGETYPVTYFSSLTYYECGKLSRPYNDLTKSNIIDIKV